MPSFLPEILKTWSDGRWMSGLPSRVSGFSIDSRKVEAGDCFVAIPTDRRDGHAYLQDALEKGASAAIVESYQEHVNIPQLVVEDSVVALQAIAAAYRQQFEGPVIAVTGSCGKTSTKELLALLLGGYGVHKTADNLNNHLGVPLTLLGLDPMEHRYAVIEAGMNQPGEIDLLTGIIDPDFALVTMVGPAHLEGVGSLEQIAWEKSALLRRVRDGGLCLFPESCLGYDAFQTLNVPCRVLGRTEKGKDRFRAVRAVDRPFSELTYEVHASERIPGGRKLLFREPRFPGFSQGEGLFHLPRLSPGMVRNMALALSLASRLGVSDTFLQLRLMQWQAPSFRGQILRDQNVYYFVDCYNANPASMIDTLEAFVDAFPEQPRIFVLGGMKELGEYTGTYHLEVGKQLRLRPQDRAFLIGEEMEAFREGAIQAGAKANQLIMTDSVEETRISLKSLLQRNHAILLKGSRRYGLEKLIPEHLRQNGEGVRAAVC